MSDNQPPQSAPPPAHARRLLARATGRMTDLRKDIDRLSNLIASAETLLPPSMTQAVIGLGRSLHSFEAPITVLGQVKAGKTALTNVLSGRPGLLPTDVNPWTSVISTLHLNGPHEPDVAAEFTFFHPEEWHDLAQRGGCLGQLAKRAGAADELRQIQAQIASMQAKAEARLGADFAQLLGSRHRFQQFDTELLEKYVCLGDLDQADDAPAQPGQFAEITRAADLNLQAPHYPIALALHDTPGVNDPFLIREQTTLRCIETAALCVLVLSAGQAMGRADLALLQLLSGTEGRQVVIFVNRIDELAQPASQIDEIRRALQQTLLAHGLGRVENIIFGSARWAEAALTDRLAALPPAAADSLRQLAASRHLQHDRLTPELAWDCSGLGKLQASIGAAIAENAGKQLIESLRRQLCNLITGALAQDTAQGPVPEMRLSPQALQAKLLKLNGAIDGYLAKDVQGFLLRLQTRLQTAKQQFLQLALTRLAAGSGSPMTSLPEADTLQLRMRLRSAFSKFSSETRSLFDALGQGLAGAFGELYGQMLGDRLQDVRIAAPQIPPLQMPLAIGRRLVVELERPWWKSWISQRSGADTLAQDYHRLLESEADAINAEVMASAERAVAEISAILRGFLAAQSLLLEGLTRGDDPETLSGATLRGEAQRLGLQALQRELRDWTTASAAASASPKTAGRTGVILGFRNAI